MTTANRAKARTSGQHCRCAFDGKEHKVECTQGSAAGTACCALSVQTAWPAALLPQLLQKHIEDKGPGEG